MELCTNIWQLNLYNEYFRTKISAFLRKTLAFEAYASALSCAIPDFIVLILIETLHTQRYG